MRGRGASGDGRSERRRSRTTRPRAHARRSEGSRGSLTKQLVTKFDLAKDRNPQTFVPNIMTAKPDDYKPATVTIYSDPVHDSSLQLPLMNACDHIDCF